MKTVDITIHIEYDPAGFPEEDMSRAAYKIAECDPVWNIGYDSDSYEINYEVTHGAS